MTRFGAHVIDTPFGDLTIVWSVFSGEQKIVRIVLPGTGTEIPEWTVERWCETAERTASGIRTLLSGEDARFDLEDMRMEICSPFQRGVLLAEYGIPRGKVSTYGLIAGAVGVPGGARAVGSALSRNPFPLVIPCHRAVRSDGSLGGYQGGIPMKRRLLEMEGMEFDRRNRLITQLYWYEDTGRIGLRLLP